MGLDEVDVLVNKLNLWLVSKQAGEILYFSTLSEALKSFDKQAGDRIGRIPVEDWTSQIEPLVPSPWEK